jgi:hypothetical protein
MPTHFTTATCPTCDTSFDRVPVEYDDDQGYAALELRTCGNCGALLCPCCEQFQCDGCAQTFCLEHLVNVPDGTLTPLRCCATCAADVEVIEMPLAPLVCACCQRVIGIMDSRTGSGDDTWHTRCWNASQERLRIAAQDYDEVQESASVPPKPMGVAGTPAVTQAEVA